MRDYQLATRPRIPADVLRKSLRRRFDDVSERIRAARRWSEGEGLDASNLPQVEWIRLYDEVGRARTAADKLPDNQLRRLTHRRMTALARRKRITILHEVWMWSEAA